MNGFRHFGTSGLPRWWSVPGGGASGRARSLRPSQKVRRLRAPRGLSVRTALVYAGELAPEVAERGYFDALVSADDLLW